MASSLWRAFTDWLRDPFRKPVDVIHLFLAVGLVLLSLIVWGRILSHLHER